jgi:prepilin-type N-terminal cleavage/methylation domain-containing protein
MRERGFSLIEVLTSMALALTLLVGTAELVTLSVWAKRKGDTTAALVQALAARAEGLKSQAFSPAGLVPGSFSETTRDEAGRGLYLHEWTVEEAGGRSLRLRIRVSPAGRPGAAASAVLYISKGLGFRP